MTTATFPTKRVGEYDRETKDYAAYIVHEDGHEELVGFRKTQGEADRLCDAYIYDLQHSELRYTATALDGGSPEWVEEQQAELNLLEMACQARLDAGGSIEPSAPISRPCERCGSPWAEKHELVIQTDNGGFRSLDDRIEADTYRAYAMAPFASPVWVSPDAPSDTATSAVVLATDAPLGDAVTASPAPEMARLIRAGAAIVRQWGRDRAAFLNVLDTLDVETIFWVAYAAVKFHQDNDPRTTLTIDQQLAAWQEAATA